MGTTQEYESYHKGYIPIYNLRNWHLSQELFMRGVTGWVVLHKACEIIVCGEWKA